MDADPSFACRPSFLRRRAPAVLAAAALATVALPAQWLPGTLPFPNVSVASTPHRGVSCSGCASGFVPPDPSLAVRCETAAVHARLGALGARVEVRLTFVNPHTGTVELDLDLPVPQAAVVDGFTAAVVRDGDGLVLRGGLLPRGLAEARYEAVRRRVDPALLTREGDIARLRLFPFPARGRAELAVSWFVPWSRPPATGASWSWPAHGLRLHQRRHDSRGLEALDVRVDVAPGLRLVAGRGPLHGVAPVTTADGEVHLAAARPAPAGGGVGIVGVDVRHVDAGTTTSIGSETDARGDLWVAARLPLPAAPARRLAPTLLVDRGLEAERARVARARLRALLLELDDREVATLRWVDADGTAREVVGDAARLDRALQDLPFDGSAPSPARQLARLLPHALAARRLDAATDRPIVWCGAAPTGLDAATLRSWRGANRHHRAVHALALPGEAVAHAAWTAALDGRVHAIDTTTAELVSALRRPHWTGLRVVGGNAAECRLLAADATAGGGVLVAGRLPRGRDRARVVLEGRRPDGALQRLPVLLEAAAPARAGLVALVHRAAVVAARADDAPGHLVDRLVERAGARLDEGHGWLLLEEPPAPVTTR